MFSPEDLYSKQIDRPATYQQPAATPEPGRGRDTLGVAQKPVQRAVGAKRSEWPSTGRYKVGESAILDERAMLGWKPGIERFAGVGLILISFISNVAFFNGAWWVIPTWQAAVGGIMVQAVCTVVEWVWRDNRLTAWYMSAMVVDVGLSIGGFALVLGAPLTKIIPATGYMFGAYDVAVWAILALMSWFVAWLPEAVLIRS